MTDWEERLFALFDDLEQQAEAAFAAQRDLEVADRVQAEYAGVDLAGRLMASVGSTVRLRVAGVGSLEARLERVAAGWCLLSGHSGEWIVRTPAVAVATGLSPRSVPDAAWPVAARLGLGSALRRLSEEGDGCRILTVDGGSFDVRLARVGADFVEAVDGSGESVLFAIAAIAAVSRRTA